MKGSRAYEESHPWITFNYKLDQDKLWCLLGEAASKCQHLAGTPLQPDLARQLAGVYLVRGAVATTAIEGNTLEEDQVQELLATGKKLPPSQQYLQQEVENVIEGLRQIDEASRLGQHFELSPDWIERANALVLRDIEDEDHVVPGQYTEVRVTAGNYRGAPPEDVPYLVDRLCQWLNEWLKPLDSDDTSVELRFFVAFVAATLGHLYIAWIHPFGNGNGRTARLLECAILAHSGVVPWVSSNLLSDHYNRTRSRYYQRLDRASRDRDVHGWLAYSAEGFVDMIREQIDRVQQAQRKVAWTNYVHEVMKEVPTGPTRERQRNLVLELPVDGLVKRNELRRLTPELAEMYAGKTDKTLTRDLNKLRTLGLISRQGSSVRSQIHVMDAFMPKTQRP